MDAATADPPEDDNEFGTAPETEIAPTQDPAEDIDLTSAEAAVLTDDEVAPDTGNDDRTWPAVFATRAVAATT